MFAKLVASLIAFLSGKGLDVAAKVSPYVLMLTPAALMVASGVLLYLKNRADTASLVLLVLLAVNEAIVAAQIVRAAKS